MMPVRPEQIVDIMIGAVFLFGGIVACAIAATLRRSGGRALVWLGIWSAVYGVVQLTGTQAVVAVLPGWLRIGAPYVFAALLYLTVVVASLAFAN